MAGSFADIYSQWEKTHDEEREIRKRAAASVRTQEEGPSINRIRRMDAQDELDLHEMLLDDAILAARSFLDRSFARGLRKVRVITGKGIHSRNGEAVIRPAVTEVCRNHPKVREVLVPKAAEGGSGALTVILKDNKAR
jgi:DNA-nicking Smr family endonuclease